jgi:hypothetical protein
MCVGKMCGEGNRGQTESSPALTICARGYGVRGSNRHPLMQLFSYGEIGRFDASVGSMCILQRALCGAVTGDR